jgi:hypothetical protein
MVSLFFAQGQKTMHNRSNMIFDNHSNGSVHLANIIMLLCTSTNRLNQFLTCSNVQLSF